MPCLLDLGYAAATSEQDNSIAMSVTSIPTNDVHNNSFTDISTTMLWPSSEYTLSKSLRLRSK